MTNRIKINKNLTMVSPLSQIGIYPYVNVFGDTVISSGTFGNAPLLLSNEECEQIVQDINTISISKQMGVEPTFLEQLMIRNISEWY